MGGELVLLKHDDRVGPGWLLDRVVAQCEFFRVLTIKQISDLPPPNECNGVVFTAHSLDTGAIENKDPLLREELIFVRTLVGLGVPYLGIDGGAQLLARAMFGDVLAERTTSIGPGVLTLTEEARDDPLLGPEANAAGVPVTLWPTHGIALPARSVLLGGTAESPQAFRLGHWTYGLLPHLEATPLMFRDWVEENERGVELGDRRKELLEGVEAQSEDQRRVAFGVMDRFIARTACFCHWESPEIDADERS